MKGRAVAAVLLLLSACAAKETEIPAAPRPGGFPQPGHLVVLLRLDNSRLSETAQLIGRTGNDAEKAAAGKHLIQLAHTVGSDGWRESQRAAALRMNPRPGIPPTQGEVRRLLDDWQERHLLRVYDAMKAIGGPAILDHCRRVVDDDDRRQAEQRLAFGVLAAHGRASTQSGQNAWGMPAGPGPRQGVQQGGQHLGWGQAPATTYPGAPAATSEGAVRAAAPPEVRGGTIENLDQVATALQPYFVICYKRALAEHGRFGAWVTLDARVVSNGHVAHVDGRGDDGVPMSMMSCLEGVVRQALFAPPRGGDAVVSLSWSFLPPAAP